MVILPFQAAPVVGIRSDGQHAGVASALNGYRRSSPPGHGQQKIARAFLIIGGCSTWLQARS
jgi:hypothetical protein